MEKAESAFGKAATLEPKNFRAQFMHASVLQEMDRLNEAIRAYLRAINIRPDDFQANLNLGTAYLQSGEPQWAFAYSKHAVELKPGRWPARANLGVVYQSLGRHEEAITEFQQAAELTELSPELLTNLADSYGRTKALRGDGRDAGAGGGDEAHGGGVRAAGERAVPAGMYDQSLASFRKAAELDSNPYPAYNGVGVCLLQQWVSGGQNDVTLGQEAIRSLQRSLQIKRNQPKVMELLGRWK